jgi:hypothetical protein
MIMIAASAVGIFGYRVTDQLFEHFTDSGYESVERGAILCGPALAAFTASLMIVRLCPPRPTRRELFQQSGFVAGFVALVLTGYWFLKEYALDRFDPHDDWYLPQEWPSAMQEASLGILVAWSILALTGSLKLERSWIDRAGRAIALVWVLTALADWVGHLVWVYQIIRREQER